MTNRRPGPVDSFRASRAWNGLLAAVVVVLLGGCSLSKEKANAEEAVSPTFYSSVGAVCDLLTAADLEGATGLKYLDGRDIETNAFGGLTGATKCVYPPEGGFGPGRGFVVSAVVYAYAEEVLQDRKHAFKGIGIEKVRGVGKDAVWVPAAAELYVLVDEKILGVHVALGGHEANEDLRERSRRLAIKAIPRLR